MSALRHVRRGAPQGVLVQYAEKLKEGGTRFAGRAVGAQRTLDDCGTAVDNLCIVPASLFGPCLFEQFDHFRVAFLPCQH